jgi:protein gp37
MQETGIEWCDFSSNLLKYRDNATNKVVWACVKCSPGCAACYAETLAHRYGRGGPYSLQQTRKVTPFFDMDETKKILRSKKIGGARIFIDDMTDLFGEWVPDEIIDKHFALFALRPDVTFQVLTKRPERMAKYLEFAGRKGLVSNAAWRMQPPADEDPRFRWPLPNVWLGTSCENQATADERIPHLLKCPAAIRFLSCEPLLGPINLTDERLPQSIGEANRWGNGVPTFQTSTGVSSAARAVRRRVRAMRNGCGQSLRNARRRTCPRS